MRFEREPKEIMRVDDISKRSRYVDKTDRKTDLMNPVYQVGLLGITLVFGEILESLIVFTGNK